MPTAPPGRPRRVWSRWPTWSASAAPTPTCLRAVVARGYVAESWDAAVSTARATGLDVATLDGELARGGHVVVGGGRQDARGILATKGEIKEVRARVEAERDALADLALLVAAAAAMAGQTQQAIEAATARLHQHEKVHGRLRRAAGPRARGRRTPRSQGRDADGRAPPGRGRDRPARGASGRGASGDRGDRIPPGGRRRAVHGGPAAAGRRAQPRRGAGHPCGRGQGRTRRPGRARSSAGCRSRAARRGRTRTRRARRCAHARAHAEDRTPTRARAGDHRRAGPARRRGRLARRPARRRAIGRRGRRRVEGRGRPPGRAGARGPVGSRRHPRVGHAVRGRARPPPPPTWPISRPQPSRRCKPRWPKC